MVDPASVASRSAIRGTVLRYKADRVPVVYVLAMLAVHVALFVWAPPWVVAVAVLPLVALSTCVATVNHNHQHLNTFRSPTLNRFYDIALSLQTGIGPYGWVLHHNLGHHRNYLNQPPHARPDESHWARKDGSTMGRLEYSVHLFLHHQFDIYKVGKRHPRQWRYFMLMKIPLYTVMAIGLVIDPVNYALAFLLPASLTLFHTCYATYEHHAGHHATSHRDASVNRENKLLNFVTCNLGLHTAHHEQPGLHWSLLPELHARIRHTIPPEQLLQDFW